MPKTPKVARKCHPEAKPKDLANEKEILRFAQNDSFAVTLVILGTSNFSHFIMVLFTFGQPRLSRFERFSGLWRSHSDGERGRYFSRAANNPAQCFFCYSNRLPYQLRDTVGPEAGVVIGRVFLRQQQGLIRLALPVHVANVGSCKYPTLPFTAESYPSAVT